MKDETHCKDEALEALLKQELEPKRPVWEVNRRILEALLLKDEREVKWQRWSGYLRSAWIAPIGLAAALVVTWVYFAGLEPSDGSDRGLTPVPVGTDGKTASAAPTVQLRSVGASKQLVGMEDKGWVKGNSDSVTREFSYEYIDTVDLVNEEDGSVIRLEIPRQEIVNVTYQVI